MSSSSTSPPSTPAQPDTPDPSFPSVRVTLPTPPSFSAHRARSQSTTPISPNKGDAPSRFHGRRVSFSAEGDDLEASTRALEVYRTPQRQSTIEEGPEPDLASSGERKIRRSPPRPLALANRGVQPGPLSAISPFTQIILSTAPGSRFAFTAAPDSDQKAVHVRGSRHSISGPSGAPTSIWSGGLHSGHRSGWISPPLGSARSTGTAARQRGLTVAVLKDEKKMVIGDVTVSPGLGSAVPLRSAGSGGRMRFRSASIAEREESFPAAPASTPTTAKRDVHKRKEGE